MNKEKFEPKRKAELRLFSYPASSGRALLRVLPLAVLGGTLAISIAYMISAKPQSLPGPHHLGEDGLDSRMFMLAYVDVGDSHGFPESLILRITNIGLPTLEEAPVARTCLDDLRIWYRVAQTGGNEVFGHQLFKATDAANEPICIDHTDEYDEFVRLNFGVEMETDIGGRLGYFAYPYDRISIEIDAYGGGRRLDASGALVQAFHDEPIFQYIYVQAADWVIVNSTDGKAGVTLRRSLLVQWLAPVIVLLLSVLILLIPRIESSGEAIQAAIALLLGVWSVRQTLMPDVAPGRTLLDIMLLAEQVAIILTLGIYLLQRRPPSPLQTNGLIGVESASGELVGSRASTVYHRPHCVYLRGKDRTVLRHYLTLADAQNDGRRPCSVCVADQGHPVGVSSNLAQANALQDQGSLPDETARSSRDQADIGSAAG